MNNCQGFDQLNTHVRQHLHVLLTGYFRPLMTQTYLVSSFICVSMCERASVCDFFFLVFSLDLISTSCFVRYISCNDWPPLIYDVCRSRFFVALNIYQSLANDTQNNSSGTLLNSYLIYCSSYLPSWSVSFFCSLTITLTYFHSFRTPTKNLFVYHSRRAP